MSESHSLPFSRVRVDSAGRIVIPSGIRQHFHIKPGQDLIVCEDDHGIRLQTFDQAVKAVQDLFALHRVPGVSVVDQLINERETEARGDDGE